MEYGIEILLGKVLSSVIQDEAGEQITFTTNEGKEYVMYHDQDCCENVRVEDVNGDFKDLIGSPILLAEVATSEELMEGQDSFDDSFTWTFYKLATVKGYVDIRWLGESNGYYSEGVTFRLN